MKNPSARQIPMHRDSDAGTVIRVFPTFLVILNVKPYHRREEQGRGYQLRRMLHLQPLFSIYRQKINTRAGLREVFTLPYCCTGQRLFMKLPGGHRRLSVTMSSPLTRCSLNSAMLSDSGRRHARPLITTSSEQTDKGSAAADEESGCCGGPMSVSSCMGSSNSFAGIPRFPHCQLKLKLSPIRFTISTKY